MFNAVAAALSAALLFQATVASPEQSAVSVLAKRLAASALGMTEILGSCEGAFPPEVGAQMKLAVTQKPDSEGQRMVLDAYERGRTSPRAATQTLESCTADLDAQRIEFEAIQAEMLKAIQAEIETKQTARPDDPA
ncbi:hypothetical protein [Brevundimonas sp.]|uniref:hypothetical protein n=1 Tax=Brevundimonas sp. TaxID=1871086 RepID=UPI003D6CA242